MSNCNYCGIAFMPKHRSPGTFCTRRCAGLQLNYLKRQKSASLKDKHCNVCEQILPVSCFGTKRRKYKTGVETIIRESSCKQCRVKVERRHRFGVSIQQFNDQLQYQQNKCAICQGLLTEHNPPCLDHCHDTNKIRGILCSSCNTGIGFMKHSISTLKQAIEYLDCGAWTQGPVVK